MTAATHEQTGRALIESLLDPGSFLEFGRSGGDSIAGAGTIDDRPVCLVTSGGTLVRSTIDKVFDLALQTGCPLISIHLGGAQRSGDVAALDGYGEIFRRSAHASGVIPQLSLVVGAVTGERALLPALSDYVIMVEPASHLFVSGPDVTRTVTGEDLSPDELGGARLHATMSGSAHYLGADEADAVDYLRDLLSYLPQNNLDDPPGYDVEAGLAPTEDDRALDRLIPDAPSQPYDMRDVITAALDDGDFCEVQELYAPNIVVAYGRIDGRSVGVVANQPLHSAGCLDIAAMAKAARFIRTCDTFNTPVVSFVDAPGFVPGTDQEWHGIARHGAKLSYAYAEATVPLVTVITRRATGGAYDVMGSRGLGADLNLAWAGAQLGAMRSERLGNAAVSAESAVAEGYLDAVIRPHQTRSEITRALRLLRTKRETLPPKKHGNIPL